MTRLTVKILIASACVLLTACQHEERPRPGVATDLLQLTFLGQDNGDDWPAYGRTYGEQHYSPLTGINDNNVGRLGLAWSMDLGVGNPATIPIEVGGTLYFSAGYSVVHAIDAVTGRLLWQYNPEVSEHQGVALHYAWGIRGIAYWNGKVYTGTQDGRLIALDAATGKEVWSVQTTPKGGSRYITGAPRVFDGKIIIGHGGADIANIRGYVTTYDAETGKQLWRFYTVPGNPADGFESKAMKMAAKTWTGPWWKYGGGGTAWNAFTYDAETDTVFVGTGNGSPWNQRIRSPQGGDNLFLCSIVALDARTGAYKWHYQFNPGETWDYNAVMDMPLADLVIDGKLRKVVMTAPKNGFFYVIDRTNGKLISAEKIAKVTWASHIDLATGRPVENPAARFPNGTDFDLWPSYTGAHSWMPTAYSPKSGLIYIPKLENGARYYDHGIDLEKLKKTPATEGPGVMGEIADASGIDDPLQNTSELLAWNPVTQKAAWRVKTIGGWNSGLVATAGDLVFQGQLDGRLSAYSADNGKELWHFQTQAAVIAAPITYRAGGHQYVTVLVGMGTSPVMDTRTHGGLQFDGRTQHKRVLTFVLDGKARLPAAGAAFRVKALEDPGYRSDPAAAHRGEAVFAYNCAACHGIQARAGGYGPDLRASPVVLSADNFAAVLAGALKENGMPAFPELSAADIAALRQYARSRAADLRLGKN